MTALLRNLDAHYYVDAANCEAERHSIFSRHWRASLRFTLAWAAGAEVIAIRIAASGAWSSKDCALDLQVRRGGPQLIQIGRAGASRYFSYNSSSTRVPSLHHRF